MATEERNEDDLFIKDKKRSSKFFITGSDIADGANKTTISSSVFAEMSKSFAEGEHLTDSHFLATNKPVLYMIQQMQEDLEDVYNEVSASSFQASYFPFLSAPSASFGLMSSSIIPHKNNLYDLGKSGQEWKDLYIDGTANIDSLAMGTTVTSIKDEDNMSSDSDKALATQQSIKAYVDANAGGGGGTIDSSITNGSTNAVQNDAIHDALALKATIAGVKGDLLPQLDGNYDLGSSGKEWQDLYVDGVAYVDELSLGVISTDLIPKTPAQKGSGQNLGSAKNRWSRIWLASNIDVSGSNLVISSPSASAAGTPFDVVISGSIVAGDTDSGSIGTIDAPFKDLYVQSSSIYLADMSTHNFGSGNKSWKQMSKSEKLQRSTVFKKEDVDKLKRGESLNDSGIISASGDLYVSGSTRLEGSTEIHGVTNIHGQTDIRGGLKINQQTITDAELRALRGLSTTDSLQDQLNSKQDTITFGISNTNVIKAGSGIADDDFLRINGTTMEGRSASELKGDLSLVKGDVGLGNVDNTSDASKPVSTATQTALNKKLNLTGGTMTGLIQPIVTAMKSAPNKGVIDARATNVFEFVLKQGATVATATPAFVGQELTIVNLGQGAITITHTGSKPQPGTFFIYGGKNLAIATGQVYKFVYTNVNQWFVIQ